MISATDFKYKQILFVKADWGVPSKLRFFNDNIVFEKDGKIANRVSIHRTFAVFIAGDLSLTTNFFKQAKKFGVSVFLIKNNFEIYGGITPSAEGHYLLRMKQYYQTDDFQLQMAKDIVKNKIYNQYSLLKEKLKNNNQEKDLEGIKNLFNSVDSVSDFDVLRGIEGNASRFYFKNIFSDYNWRRRAPRTKEDPINLYLDMGYTYLFNFVDSLLRLHGFDTFKGFYHKLFFQRRSLSCDIIEPFRPIIDRQIIKSINLGQFKEKDLKIEKGAYILPFENQTKFVSVFLDLLMENKTEIFGFVQEFYRFVMDDQKYSFPFYKIDK